MSPRKVGALVGELYASAEDPRTVLGTPRAFQSAGGTPAHESAGSSQRLGWLQNSDTGQGDPEARVWVNTGSGVYHCPGTRWYGRTKRGLYTTQREARARGNRPAYGSVCR